MNNKNNLNLEQYEKIYTDYTIIVNRNNNYLKNVNNEFIDFDNLLLIYNKIDNIIKELKEKIFNIKEQIKNISDNHNKETLNLTLTRLIMIKNNYITLQDRTEQLVNNLKKLWFKEEETLKNKYNFSSVKDINNTKDNYKLLEKNIELYKKLQKELNIFVDLDNSIEKEIEKKHPKKTFKIENTFLEVMLDALTNIKKTKNKIKDIIDDIESITNLKIDYNFLYFFNKDKYKITLDIKNNNFYKDYNNFVEKNILIFKNLKNILNIWKTIQYLGYILSDMKTDNIKNEKLSILYKELNNIAKWKINIIDFNKNFFISVNKILNNLSFDIKTIIENYKEIKELYVKYKKYPTVEKLFEKYLNTILEKETFKTTKKQLILFIDILNKIEELDSILKTSYDYIWKIKDFWLSDDNYYTKTILDNHKKIEDIKNIVKKKNIGKIKEYNINVNKIYNETKKLNNLVEGNIIPVVEDYDRFSDNIKEIYNDIENINYYTWNDEIDDKISFWKKELKGKADKLNQRFERTYNQLKNESIKNKDSIRKFYMNYENLWIEYHIQEQIQTMNDEIDNFDNQTSKVVNAYDKIKDYNYDHRSLSDVKYGILNPVINTWMYYWIYNILSNKLEDKYENEHDTYISNNSSSSSSSSDWWSDFGSLSWWGFWWWGGGFDSSGSSSW